MFFTYQTLGAEETKELTDLLYNFNTKRKSKAGSFRYLAREPARTIDIGDAYCNE